MASQWRIELFGPLQATLGDQQISRFKTQKTAGLLAYLAMYPDQKHEREKLAAILWPDATTEKGRSNLRQSLTSLRKQLESGESLGGALFITDYGSLKLNGAAIQVDVHEFRDLLAAEGQTQDPTVKRDLLIQALQLVRGELLPGFREDWVELERMQLSEEHCKALRKLSNLYERSGELELALEHARTAVVIDPLDEELHRIIMRLYGVMGQISGAVRQYQELEKLLKRELNEVPSSATKMLFQQIRKGQVPKKVARPVVLAPPNSSQESDLPQSIIQRREPNLPAPLTRFFGRDAELELIGDCFFERGRRLITLTGPGGSGKTRLAVEAARKFADKFDGAVWFVPLADLQNAKQIPDAIAQSMGLPRVVSDSREKQIITSMRNIKKSLLVLDNYERLADEGSEVPDNLLSKVSDLHIIVTSRDRLNLYGEQEIPVNTLPVAKASSSLKQMMDYPSMQLFVDRAQLSRVDFQITDRNAELVRELCHRLEGIPLAIELAASWAQTINPQQMLEHLKHRFEFLVQRGRFMVPRHRSMRAAIDYSFFYLDEPLQKFFLNLCIFQDGWSVEAAKAVTGEKQASRFLTKLRDHSMVSVAPTNCGQERYRLLETLREYADEKIEPEQLAPLEESYADYFVSYAWKAVEEMSGPGQKDAFQMLEREHLNLNAAIRWLIEHKDCERSLKLAIALSYLAEFNGPIQEGRDWLVDALALVKKKEQNELVAMAQDRLGIVCCVQTDFVAGERAIAKALEIWEVIGNREGYIRSLHSLGGIYWRREDYATLHEISEKGLEIAKELNDRAGMARALLNLGNVSLELNDYNKAQEYYNMSLELERKEGNLERQSRAFYNLGYLAHRQGKYELSKFYFNECLAVASDFSGNGPHIVAHFGLGIVANELGDYDEAYTHFTRSVELQKELPDPYWLRSNLMELGRVHLAQGEYQKAATLLFASEMVYGDVNAPYSPTQKAAFEELMRLLEHSMDEEELEMARAYASKMSLEMIIEYAISEPASDAA